MKRIRLILAAAGLLLAAGAAAQPALVTRNGVTRFEIDGKPFVMFGGELHNSTSSSEQYMDDIDVWEQMEDAHFNFVIASASWELVEPQEGRYDFSSVDHVIRNARKHGLKVVMIWFASWKNGYSTYAPGYVKRNPKKYPLAEDREGKTLNVLSTFGKMSDTRYFVILIQNLVSTPRTPGSNFCKRCRIFRRIFQQFLTSLHFSPEQSCISIQDAFQLTNLARN